MTQEYQHQRLSDIPGDFSRRMAFHSSGDDNGLPRQDRLLGRDSLRLRPTPSDSPVRTMITNLSGLLLPFFASSDGRVGR